MIPVGKNTMKERTQNLAQLISEDQAQAIFDAFEKFAEVWVSGRCP